MLPGLSSNICTDIVPNIQTSSVIREARRRSGLSQAELARRAGTSQPTLASYEAGRIAPRLETVGRLLEAAGHDLEITAIPKVRRGAVPIARVARELRRLLPREGARAGWRRLLDFVDDFRGSPRAGQVWLIEHAPASCGDPRFDAAIAGLVELLCDEAGIDWPRWTDDPKRFAEPWWFVSGLRGFEAAALRDSPVEFKRHGVFVNEGAFDRA